MGFFLLFLLFPFVNSLLRPIAPGVSILCNRLTGNYHGVTVMFGRPLENGDSITWNGTIAAYANSANVPDNLKWTLWGTPSLNEAPFHMRQDVPKQTTIWNNFVGKWQYELYGPALFQLGQPYQVTVKMVGNAFQAYTNGVLMYSFPIRSSVAGIMAADFVGAGTTNWIEIQCANPPFTTRSPRPPRPGHGHGGHGGKHHHNSGSSSDESCEH
uniref:Galectin n=1 Tax=Caenorhabditis tropicalis TaxID=1561998 RepID=A0A1I7UGA5_9PELO